MILQNVTTKQSNNWALSHTSLYTVRP